MGTITREQVLEFVDTIPGASVDQPFAMDFDTTILRHIATKKWFGAILHVAWGKLGIERDGEADILNLKCDPLLAYGLMQANSSILPGYHMNKHHWITVLLDGDVEMDLLRTLILDSYQITDQKRPGKSRKKSAE